MNAKTFFITMIIIALASPISAKVWLVDNNTVNQADFRDLSAAHNAASSGDTIYVAGSAQKYIYTPISKMLFIIGTGYFLNENPNTQARPISSVINGFINFNDGSEGSILTGFKIEGGINISVKNIMIKRNYIIISGENSCIYLLQSASNTIINQNYLTHVGDYDWRVIQFTSASIQNVIISNNFINPANSSATAINMGSTNSAEISYNVIKGKLGIYNAVLRNNILREGTISGQGNTFQNNIGNSTQFGTSDGNKSNITMSSVFAGTGSTDGQWQLKLGSPAIGAGINGTDCGMFGGTTPYVLSGLPSIPRIYFFSAPISASGSTGLSVKIKAKSGAR